MAAVRSWVGPRRACTIRPASLRRCCSSARSSGKLARHAPPWFPLDRAELQHLRSDAGRIVHARLGPTHDLTAAIYSRRKSIVAPQRRQPTHVPRLPDETETVVQRERGKKRRTAPVLSQGIE